MCGCLAIALGAFFPRIALIFIALFTSWISTAFNGEWLLPLLGWLLLPYTTLSYVLLHLWLGDVTGFTWAFIILAFLVDLGAYGSSARSRQSGWN